MLINDGNRGSASAPIGLSQNLDNMKHLILNCIICLLFFSCTDENPREDILSFNLDGQSRDISNTITVGQNMYGGIVIHAGPKTENLTIVLGSKEKKKYSEEDLEPLPPDSLTSTEDTAMLYAFASNNYFFIQTDSIKYTALAPKSSLIIELIRYKYESTGKFELEGEFEGTLYPADTTHHHDAYITVSDGAFYYSNFN